VPTNRIAAALRQARQFIASVNSGSVFSRLTMDLAARPKMYGAMRDSSNGSGGWRDARFEHLAHRDGWHVKTPKVRKRADRSGSGGICCGVAVASTHPRRRSVVLKGLADT
jgi:hypothetical protein